MAEKQGTTPVQRPFNGGYNGGYNPPPTPVQRGGDTYPPNTPHRVVPAPLEGRGNSPFGVSNARATGAAEFGA